MQQHGLIFNITQHPYLSRPLGGHRIAHFLREHDWDIEVVDWANWWALDQLKELVRSRCHNATKFIGFSHLFSIWTDVMEEFSQWLKNQYPDVKLISGSSVNPMFRTKNIDWYVQGFGEHAILDLLRYISGNGPRPRFHLLGDRKVIAAIDSYPAFPMKSLMVKYQDRDFIESHEWLTVELSRGCKFKCDFCQFPVLGVKEDTSRDADDFREQLQDAYDRFGITNYMVADETANDRIEKISKFADVVQTLNFMPWFSAYIRLDLMAADPQQSQELLRMNVLGHFYGIESMNTKSARSIGKGMKSEKIQQSLLSVKDYFLNNGRRLYRGHIGLIAGLPFETKETFWNTINWLIENWQGQSWGAHFLGLPAADSVRKQSEISKNILAYGYTEMTPDQVQKADFSVLEEIRKTQTLGNFKEIESEIYWQNEHMNIFDAQRLIRDCYRVKKLHDFRPGNFMINHRMRDKNSLEERLAMSFDEHDNLLDNDVSQYINKKLSASGKSH